MSIKGITGKVLIFALSSGIVLVGFEIYLRSRGVKPFLYERDKKTNLTVLKRSGKLIHSSICFKNVVRPNSWGFHSREFKEKAEDEFRILVVGDSQVEAVQVPLEKTFHYILQNKLQKALGKNITVYAIGHGGNGTYYNYLYFKKYGEKLKPDMVILLFNSNDISEDSYELTMIYGKQTGDSLWIFLNVFPEFDEENNLKVFKFNKAMEKIYVDPMNPFAKSEDSLFFKIKSFLKSIRIVALTYESYIKLRSFILSKRFSERISKKEKKQDIKKDEMKGKNDSQIELEIPIWRQIYVKEFKNRELKGIWERAWELEEKLLSRFKEDVEKIGAEFVIISIAGIFPYIEGDIFDGDKPHKVLKKIAEKLQVKYIYIVPKMREFFEMYERKKNIYFTCDGHWNETGHKWASEIIFKEILPLIKSKLKEKTKRELY